MKIAFEVTKEDLEKLRDRLVHQIADDFSYSDLDIAIIKALINNKIKEVERENGMD